MGVSVPFAMGAKVARPDKLCINFLGDTAFGMCGMDLETAVRERIPVLTVLINNGAMGGYDKYMPIATEKFNSRFLTGDYRAVAEVHFRAGYVPADQDIDAFMQAARAIGEVLHLSEKTVRNHVSQLLRKLGFQRRSQAATWAGEWMPGSRPPKAEFPSITMVASAVSSPASARWA